MTLLILAKQSVWIPGVGESSSRPLSFFSISGLSKPVNVCQTGMTLFLQIHTETQLYENKKNCFSIIFDRYYLKVNSACLVCLSLAHRLFSSFNYFCPSKKLGFKKKNESGF